MRQKQIKQDVMHITAVRNSKAFASARAYDLVKKALADPTNQQKRIKISFSYKEPSSGNTKAKSLDVVIARSTFFEFRLNERAVSGVVCPITRELRLKQDFLGYCLTNRIG